MLKWSSSYRCFQEQKYGQQFAHCFSRRLTESALWRFFCKLTVGEMFVYDDPNAHKNSKVF
jgi:hypothetical protein